MSFRRLQQRIDELNSAVVVGLDPTDDLVPPGVTYKDYIMGIIDAVSDIVPAVKPQAAFYEAYGSDGSGMQLLNSIACYARDKGMYVILDAKRGDIGSTASAYASAYLIKDSPYDAITINGYLGSDGIIPFRDAARLNDKGVFVLVKTSNPSSGELQDLDAGGKTVYEIVAELVRRLNIGDEDMEYPSLGAVIGATYPEQLSSIRTQLPAEMLLVPGFGAQGGTAEDAAKGFINGKCAIVNSSRAVLGAWKKTGKNGIDFAEAARGEALLMRDSLRKAAGHTGH